MTCHFFCLLRYILPVVCFLERDVCHSRYLNLPPYLPVTWILFNKRPPVTVFTLNFRSEARLLKISRIFLLIETRDAEIEV